METMKISDADICKKVAETIAYLRTEPDEEKKIQKLCAIHLKKYGCDVLKDAVKQWENNSTIEFQEGKLCIDFEEEYTNYPWYTDIMYNWKSKLKKLEQAQQFAEKYDQLQEPIDEDIVFIINWVRQRVA